MIADTRQIEEVERRYREAGGREVSAPEELERPEEIAESEPAEQQGQSHARLQIEAQIPDEAGRERFRQWYRLVAQTITDYAGETTVPDDDPRIVLIAAKAAGVRIR